jgi:hypothetical protein
MTRAGRLIAAFRPYFFGAGAGTGPGMKAAVEPRSYGRQAAGGERQLRGQIEKKGRGRSQ